MDIYLLIKNKNNPALLILNVLFFVFNYSICFGEYILHSVIVPNNSLYETAYGNIYLKGLIIFFLFNLIRFLFFKTEIKR